MKKSYRDDILKYAAKMYKTQPEYLWARDPNYAVLRRSDNRKWYGVIMDVPCVRLGLAGDGVVDILNVKCDPGLYSLLDKRDGILRGYHMGGTWVSILLDGSVERNQIYALLDNSYKLVATKYKKQEVHDKKSHI